MKFHKLVKSIDYVTYPSYLELRKINKKLGDSLSSIQNVLVSALIGFFLDKIMMFRWLADVLKNETLKAFFDDEIVNKLTAFAIALLFYYALKFIRYADSRWGSNKDTVDERKSIVFTFYRCIVPNLISLKSLLQQHDESDKDEIDKRYLLLLQAHHEVCDIFDELDKINVVEFRKTPKKMLKIRINNSSADLNQNDNEHEKKSKDKEIEKNSKDVLKQIGPDVYLAVLKELLINTNNLFDKTVQLMKDEKDEKDKSQEESEDKSDTVFIDDILDSLNSYVVSSAAISASKGLEAYKQVDIIKDLDSAFRNKYRGYKGLEVTENAQ